MTDSFMHNHQSALDSQREDDAIKDLQDSGIYPDPGNEEFEDDDDPIDEDFLLMSSFGTKWHDGL